jgi:cell volume regulation protein A
MTAAIIITFCVLLLVAYLFDLTSARTRIPSVILLLALGWFVKQATVFLGLEIPNLDDVLPVFATLGLILIVLEGSLELELNKSKVGLITKSLLGALLSMLVLAFGLAYLLHYLYDFSITQSLINVIPLCVISSAIAIPSVRNLSKKNREFVIYESSLSDIIGVIFFNFMVFNEVYNAKSFGTFGLEIFIILVISALATIGLSMLLNRIDHHIKFVPIILLLIVIYEVMKVYHLPALIFILIFGLFLGNLDEISHLKLIKKLKPQSLNAEVLRFQDLIVEGTFLIRALFFLLFGFQIETADLINTDSIALAIAVVIGIYAIRLMQLVISRLPLFPLIFVAPRGLITILLFISILPQDSIPIINNSLILKVIIITAFIMMFGMLTNTEKKELPPEPDLKNGEHGTDEPTAEETEEADGQIKGQSPG